MYFLHVNYYVCRETDIQACRIEATFGQRHFHIPGLPVDGAFQGWELNLASPPGGQGSDTLPV